jgi:ParB-like chromosome segregation protein Spo0J
MIVKGHGRYQAAIRAGLSMVPVEYQNYETEADEVRHLISNNKIAEDSLVDCKATAELTKDLRLNSKRR